jgi:heavy metal translocating P-type ATPase
MKFNWSGNLLTLIASVAGMIGGAGLYWSGNHELAGKIWIAGTLPALVILLRSIVRSLMRREAGIDILALFSISGAILLGEYLTGALIAVMLASGRALEDYAQQRAGNEMSALLANAPKTANRFDDGELVQVALDMVKPYDRLLVRSGEVVPVDGSLTSALAVLDESALTGESVPVERKSGELLRSGALNAAAPFEMRATSTSADSTYAGIVKLVAAAQNSKAPASRLADRYALWFLPASLALAGMAWLMSGNPVRALAVLVVATPCPLILAVPIAIVAGMSSCARRGVLIKGGGALEKLAQAKILFFDKTGTLTGGRARLVRIEAEPDISQGEVLRIAASLDQMSGHVIAAAVVAAARERSLPLSVPGDVSEKGGAGLSGLVDGRRVAIGSWDYVSASANAPDWAMRFLEQIGEEGGSAVFVAVEGRLIGALQMADQIRLETPRALRMLRRAGIERIVMLTGDRRDIAETIGASIGVDDVRSEQTPAEKRAAIESGRAMGTTLMVGDGINDAPALAVADVGIAMGARGAAASSEAADVVLLVDRLDRVVEALNTARQVRQIAVQSVIIGMGLSILAMLVAALGYLPPLYGAALQEIIDVLAILNALRALRIKPLRVSHYTLTEDQQRHLRADHEQLAPVLEQLSFVAGQLATMPPDMAVKSLSELDAMLQQRLLPHEKADEADVYPVVSTLLGGDDPMAAMSRTHQEIFNLGRQISRLVKTLPLSGPKIESLHELQRYLYSLDAILRLHFAQEEEIYQTLA